jgi:hypothetical protein
MTPLRRNEKERIFDYCLGLTRTEQAIPFEAFLAHNEQAADIRARIQAALGPLESLHPEPCPAELAERTIRLLCATAQRSPTASCMRTIDSSLHGQEDRQQCPGEFDTYDTGEATIMGLAPQARADPANFVIVVGPALP